MHAWQGAQASKTKCLTASHIIYFKIGYLNRFWGLCNLHGLFNWIVLSSWLLIISQSRLYIYWDSFLRNKLTMGVKPHSRMCRLQYNSDPSVHFWALLVHDWSCRIDTYEFNNSVFLHQVLIHMWYHITSTYYHFISTRLIISYNFAGYIYNLKRSIIMTTAAPEINIYVQCWRLSSRWYMHFEGMTIWHGNVMPARHKSLLVRISSLQFDGHHSSQSRY